MGYVDDPLTPEEKEIWRKIRAKDTSDSSRLILSQEEREEREWELREFERLIRESEPKRDSNKFYP